MTWQSCGAWMTGCSAVATPVTVPTTMPTATRDTLTGVRAAWRRSAAVMTAPPCRSPALRRGALPRPGLRSRRHAARRPTSPPSPGRPGAQPEPPRAGPARPGLVRPTTRVRRPSPRRRACSWGRSSQGLAVDATLATVRGRDDALGAERGARDALGERLGLALLGLTQGEAVAGLAGQGACGVGGVHR